MKTLLALAILPMLALTAAAQGLVIPTEPDVPPLALVKHAVRVQIDHQAAMTIVEQVFRNHTDRQLEAQYVFPVPRGAAITGFTMLVNGKEETGQMVEKNEARRIYNSIVQRSQDPGLLEHVGNDLFRANIFPILPRSEQRITVRFSQVLLAEGPLVSYVYPVRGSQRHAPTVHGEFSLEADVRSPASIRTIYSPSHPVSFVRKNDREARASFSERGKPLDRDFRLFFGLDEREIGLHGATFRPDPANPGYFMMLMSPRVELPVQKIVERDVVFVVDVSGSMAGEKIKQARAALKHCLNSLNDGDRFAVVAFSSYAEPWRKDWASASADRKAALAHADTLMAQGGTDIAGALDAALAYPRTPERPSFVMFMTDGKPTLGETTDPKRILAKSKDVKGVRIFTWGVGYDVDAQLLDSMAENAGGVSEYVRPEEDIEVKVSSFWAKAGRPVLTDLKVEVIGEKVQLANVFPRALPDLYAGSQIVLFGRYTGSGDVALRLTGMVNGKPQEFTYEMNFAEKDARHAFVENLWARRRIGALLDQIRLHGETKELVDDVIRLSKEYGIQTPYTSSLILEPGMAPAAMGGRGGRGVQFGMDRDLNRRHANEEALKKLAPQTAAAPAPAVASGERKAQADTAKDLAEGFDKRDGAAAVRNAQYLKGLKEAECGSAQGWAPTVKACNTNLRQLSNLWVDDRYDAKQNATVVKFGSAAYFRILELKPELNDAFKVGCELVLVTAPNQALVVTSSGLETLEDEKIAALFR